ncbi:mitogen-activated protein kinase kinase kinase kinase 5-like [Halichondria panicea]|uniref:mitogen-activated protein kinase kinase kinase kinase 5-like n=1 Tax=Halichondria panicea TaxID=6063 RepID=UPI00312BAD06
MADGILNIIQRKNPDKEFDILKQIGSGTYGEVYKARVKATGQMVALKIIKLEPGEDFNIIQQEIAILADCKQRNIVGFHGSYLRRDRLWIAMEYCGGGSVQDIYHVTNQGLNELQIAFICREMLAGLEYLHERNMIHRDIKGANILLTDDGEVKLADFGIAAQLTQTLMMKRKSFIGTPYWMAPEVAAVERKGGYNQQCDIWAVGITAIEFAEKQPPMFDLHPMRALYLMTKRNFRSPGLQHKNKWSDNFHDFLRNALQKEPRRRPTATELLKHEFVNRPALCSTLTITLIKVLEAPPPKPKTPVEEDPEDEPEDFGEKKKKFKRISSVKNQDRISRQTSDAEMGGLNLPVPRNSQAGRQDMPPWLASAADAEVGYKPRIQRLDTAPMSEDTEEYYDPDQDKDSSKEPPPPPYAPPIPPRQSQKVEGAQSPTESPLYGNVGQPPVPPRHRPTQTSPQIPPLPPRSTKTNGPSRPTRQSESGRAYFSKIFNGCPLHLTCAAAWTHPTTKKQYVMLGAEEGLFSLLVTDNPEPVMEQVSSRACHWLRVVESALVWLAGSSRHINMTNLVLLFQTDASKASIPHASYGRSKTHTTRVPDSKGSSHCCVVRNPFTEQRYLVAAVSRGLLLMQWFQPHQIFKHVMHFECQLPQPLVSLEAFIDDKEEYPSVCYGIKILADSSIYFESINLNTASNWYTDKPDGKDLSILSLQQLEKDTFFVGLEHKAMFVDRQGKLKPSQLQASELNFDKPSERMVHLSNCVLSFHRHGMQGKSLATQQVTAEVADGTKVFHLLGSHGTIIIETRPLTDPSAPSNIYILVSEDSPQN